MREWSYVVFLQTSLRQLQQELADSLKKLSMCEASLEVNTRYRNDLEEEKARTLKDMDRLKAKVPITSWKHVYNWSLRNDICSFIIFCMHIH